jgi:hypothetical protein
MATHICAQCGATFTEQAAYSRHYIDEHPDQPFPELRDTPAEDEGGRSWGGADPTDADRPANIIEELMEEAPEDTPEGDAFG